MTSTIVPARTSTGLENMVEIDLGHPISGLPIDEADAEFAWLAEVGEAIAQPLGQKILVGLCFGWDLTRERKLLARAVKENRALVSVRVGATLAVGPVWSPYGHPEDSGLSSCAGCAEARRRVAIDHPLLDQYAIPLPEPGVPGPFGAVLREVLIADLRRNPLGVGDLVEVSTLATSRHRVRRSFACPVCGPRNSDVTLAPPPARPLHSHPSQDPVATRADGGIVLDHQQMRSRLVDDKYGPILHIMRESEAPFAMSDAILPDSRNLGYGRAMRYADSEPIAILEAYERLGGFPHHHKVLTERSFSSLGPGLAVDPSRLGQYSQKQLDHPLARVMASDADTPMDWVWGHDLAGHPRLVPAEAGFYLYDYQFRLDYHTARRSTQGRRRRHYLHESSSGCALGNSYEEAALHSLLELNERDAFLLAWHRATPLPEIDLASITDPDSEQMVQFIHSRGYEPHLLVATSDTHIPVVWALALDKTGRQCATFSAASSSPDPTRTVRGSLWELTQIVGQQPHYDPVGARRFLEDPWQIDLLEHHVQLYSLQETRGRVERCARGPRVGLDEAFPGWPDSFIATAAGDVRRALSTVADLFAASGMDEIVLVDQSTRDHTDLGLAVVKAVVPGIVPMCFGHAQQRVLGLPRLEAALRAGGQVPDAQFAPYDPHPFP